MRGPQGLRRPRFSFFIFTCQTAREREALTLQQEAPKPSSDGNNQPTTIGWSCTHLNGELRRRVNRAEALGQGVVAALSGRLISPPDPACQRPMSTNRRTTGESRPGPKSRTFSTVEICVSAGTTTPRRRFRPSVLPKKSGFGDPSQAWEIGRRRYANNELRQSRAPPSRRGRGRNCAAALTEPSGRRILPATRQ